MIGPERLRALISPWRRRALLLPLRGADLVFLAMHRQYADTPISQNTMLVVECDRPVEPARARRAFERLPGTCPWVTARLRRPFPWGALYWAASRQAGLDGPPIREVAGVTSHAALHQRLEGELNAALDPDREPPARLSIIEGPAHGQGRGSLVLTWYHPLMDPRGGQMILRHLAELDPALDKRSCRATPPTSVPRHHRSLRERARLGRQTLDDMRALTRVPAVSPGTGLTSFGRARFWHGAFVPDARGAGDTHATRDVCWRLAVVGKAMTALWQKRGLPERPFLVPISVDLRPKGAEGPAVGNWLAFHFARFEPADTADVARVARQLRVQMADAVREGRVDANAVGMEFLRYRPLGIMRRSLPGGLGGDAFSFNFADLGDSIPGLSTVFGQRIVNAYHAPAVLPRPGLGVFFNRFGDRNNLVISWVEGAMTDDEVAHLAELVREGMGWAEAP